jgi:hypothetical protein
MMLYACHFVHQVRSPTSVKLNIQFQTSAPYLQVLLEEESHFLNHL